MCNKVFQFFRMFTLTDFLFALISFVPVSIAARSERCRIHRPCHDLLLYHFCMSEQSDVEGDRGSAACAVHAGRQDGSGGDRGSPAGRTSRKQPRRDGRRYGHEGLQRRTDVDRPTGSVKRRRCSQEGRQKGKSQGAQQVGPISGVYSLASGTSKGKGTYTWYSASSWNTTSEALRYGMCSQGILQFYLHTHTFNPQSKWATPAFAFPATAGIHLPSPVGWKAELAWVAGYVVRQFTCLKVLTELKVAQLRYYYYYRVLRAICCQPVDGSLICFM